MLRIHFIAIGGAAMHNLAIALENKGMHITGSDDEIFDPSLSRLREHGLLPESWGWHPEKITNAINIVILGMHARVDNPELIKARELGLTIVSYPEFLYEQTQNKTRVVIAGSHGKTSITAMVLHILKFAGRKFDYMVGSQIEGFSNMVGLNDESDVAVFEGDEYLSSPIDLRPKFLHYKPDIALISGIAWDHINVFPTFEEYVRQFELLIKDITSKGSLIYFEQDQELQRLIAGSGSSIRKFAYNEHESLVTQGTTCLVLRNGKNIPLKVFGKHNLQNINGARQVCELLGISDDTFYAGIVSFGGTARRLQKLKDSGEIRIFLDFAHSPSKVRATVDAVKLQYPERELIAIVELHTFSSLNKSFLPQYRNTLAGADTPVVFYSRKVIEHKNLETFSEEYVAQCFGHTGLKVISDRIELETYLSDLDIRQKVVLLMSSGNFGGIDMKQIFAVE
jgi:UDP-N-acetylmuramate: L-alanyl-gamma-D-glutamyl-meso-diaminopimelate ligase